MSFFDWLAILGLIMLLLPTITYDKEIELLLLKIDNLKELIEEKHQENMLLIKELQKLYERDKAALSNENDSTEYNIKSSNKKKEKDNDSNTNNSNNIHNN